MDRGGQGKEAASECLVGGGVSTPGATSPWYFLLRSAQAAIAQLGERQTEDLKVPGSIPGLGIMLQIPGTSTLSS